VDTGWTRAPGTLRIRDSKNREDRAIAIAVRLTDLDAYASATHPASISPKLRALFGWFCCVSCAYGSLLIDRCSH